MHIQSFIRTLVFQNLRMVKESFITNRKFDAAFQTSYVQPKWLTEPKIMSVP